MSASSLLKRKLNTDGNCDGSNEKKKTNSFWALGLVSSINDISLHIESDEKMVVIKDKYPKARHHFLILPRKNIPDLKSLTSEDIDLLKHLDSVGWKLAERHGKREKFRIGYHAIPSMRHLHMHVISQDFDSPFLKTKKHWNTFTTSHFIDSADLIKQLLDTGKFHTDTANHDLIKLPLKCHVCSETIKNIPTLKTHLKSHNL